MTLCKRVYMDIQKKAKQLKDTCFFTKPSVSSSAIHSKSEYCSDKFQPAIPMSLEQIPRHTVSCLQIDTLYTTTRMSLWVP